MTEQPASASARLDHDRVWQVIAAQRLSLADLLDELTDEQWNYPSLCSGSTVRDVAAHLTLQQLGLRDTLGTMLHWRGTMNRTIAHAARRRAAAWTTGQIIAEIRAHGRLPSAHPWRHRTGNAHRHHGPQPGHRPAAGPPAGHATGRCGRIGQPDPRDALAAAASGRPHRAPVRAGRHRRHVVGRHWPSGQRTDQRSAADLLRQNRGTAPTVQQRSFRTRRCPLLSPDER